MCAWDGGVGKCGCMLSSIEITGHQLFLEAARTLDFKKSCSHLIYSAMLLNNYGWVNLNFSDMSKSPSSILPSKVINMCSDQCVYLTI